MSLRTDQSALRTRSGFTLIELLVVVGIIALLIAIILPSLGRAREAVSRDAACASNVRQISIGLFAYATSFATTICRRQELTYPAEPAADGANLAYSGLGFHHEPAI